MSLSKFSWGLSVCLLLPATQACVSKQTYETHVSELNETVAQRENEIAQLREFKAKYEHLKSENELLRVHREAYEELSKDIKEALESLKDDGIERNPTNGAWVLGTDFLFRSGSWEISAEGQRALKKFVAAFKGKDVRFRIVGHTDVDPIQQTKDKIKSGMNLELGMYRAFKVAEMMHREGVKELNMWTESKGMAEPISKPETSAAAKKKNRRVEIFVLSNASMPPSSGSK
jgi:flagellar motor protein MotB